MQNRDIKTILIINVELLLLVGFLLVVFFFESNQTGTMILRWSTAPSLTDQHLPVTLQIIGREHRGGTFFRQVRFADKQLEMENLQVGTWEFSLVALDEQGMALACSLPITVNVRKNFTQSVNAVLVGILGAIPVPDPVDSQFVPVNAPAQQIPAAPTSVKVAIQTIQEESKNELPPKVVQQKPLFSFENAVFDEPVTLFFDVENPQLVGVNGMSPVLMDAPMTIACNTIVQIFADKHAEPITHTFRIRTKKPTVQVIKEADHAKLVSMYSNTSGAVLRYTIKGETYPYTGPFVVHESANIEVFAVKQGMEPSQRVSCWVEVERLDILETEPCAQEVLSIEEDIDPLATIASVEQDWNVGSPGPAGGIVFLDKGYYSDGWRYLEAAPEDEKEPYRWGQYGYWQNTGDIGEGCGITNTDKLLSTELPLDCALSVCKSKMLKVGQHVYDDWFLPSRDELLALLQFKHIAGMDKSSYWSSSEVSSVLAWQVHPTTLKASQYYKNAKHAVRAVRAF